jgi:hypothetical protein
VTSCSTVQWGMYQVIAVGSERGFESPPLPLPERYAPFFRYGGTQEGKLHFHFPADRIENMCVVEG